MDGSSRRPHSVLSDVSPPLRTQPASYSYSLGEPQTDGRVIKTEHLTTTGISSMDTSYSSLRTHETDTYQDVPLNLTVSSRRNRLENRLSPEADASSSRSRVVANGNSQHDENNQFVEEHFQRSLGSLYTALQSQSTRNSTTREPSLTRCRSNPDASEQVFVNGSVDDHFSKSLGGLWLKVNTSATSSAVDFSRGLPTSVKDHCTKALGKTLFEIQSEKDCRPETLSSSSSSYRQYESPQRLLPISYSR